jgi:hypothetical protein
VYYSDFCLIFGITVRLGKEMLLAALEVPQRSLFRSMGSELSEIETSSDER